MSITIPPVTNATAKHCAVHHGGRHLLQMQIRYPLIIAQYASNLLMRAQLRRGTKASGESLNYSAVPWGYFSCLGTDGTVWLLKYKKEKKCIRSPDCPGGLRLRHWRWAKTVILSPAGCLVLDSIPSLFPLSLPVIFLLSTLSGFLLSWRSW